MKTVWILIFSAIIDRSSACDLKVVNQTGICANARVSYTEHQVTCLIPERNILAKLRCEIEPTHSASSVACRTSGCINALLKIESTSRDVETLDAFNYAAFQVTITETKTSHVIKVSSFDGILESINSLLEPIRDRHPQQLNAVSQTIINKNVDLDFEGAQAKTALLQITNIGQEFFYDVCIRSYGVNGSEEQGARHMCCNLRKYKIELENINDIYLPFLIILFLFVIQIVIAVVTWRCPRSRYETIDDLLKSLPSKNVKILKTLVLNRQSLVQKKSLPKGENNGSFEPEADDMKFRRKIEIITVDDQGRPLETKKLGKDNTRLDSDESDKVGSEFLYLGAQNDDIARTVDLRKRNSMFNSNSNILLRALAIDNDGKFKNKIDARKKSVFFHPDLFQPEPEENQAARKRKNTLLKMDFFLSPDGTFHKPQINAKNGRKRTESLNTSALDDYDVTRAKILQEARRKQSVSQYQRALSLNPDFDMDSDSDSE
jgi:hypothetical protein